MLDIEPHILVLQVAREALAAALMTGPVLLGLLARWKRHPHNGRKQGDHLCSAVRMGRSRFQSNP